MEYSNINIVQQHNMLWNNKIWYIGLSPLPVIVTTITITFITCFVGDGDAFYLQLLTITGRGDNPNDIKWYVLIIKINN